MCEVINGLVKRKEEITIQLRDLQQQVKTLDAAIRIFSPQEPKKRIVRGGISRKMLDILASVPLLIIRSVETL